MSEVTPKRWKYQEEITIPLDGGMVETRFEIYSDGGLYDHLATCETAEKAALIVKAVNRYHLFDDLVRVAKSSQAAMGAHGPCKNHFCFACKATWLELRLVLEAVEESL